MTRRRSAGAAHGCSGPPHLWPSQLERLDPDRFAEVPADLRSEVDYIADRANWPNPDATAWDAAVERARAARRRQLAIVGYLRAAGRLTAAEVEQLDAVTRTYLERLDADDAEALGDLLHPQERHHR